MAILVLLTHPLAWGCQNRMLQHVVEAEASQIHGDFLEELSVSPVKKIQALLLGNTSGIDSRHRELKLRELLESSVAVPQDDLPEGRTVLFWEGSQIESRLFLSSE